MDKWHKTLNVINVITNLQCKCNTFNDWKSWLMTNYHFPKCPDQAHLLWW